MDTENVIPFRTREGVAPRPERLPAYRDQGVERLRVDILGNIGYCRLWQGLSSVGLTFKLDASTGRVVISKEQ